MSIKKCAIYGGGVGLTLCGSAFFLAGAGHGSSIPALLFFAPLALLSPLDAFLGDTFLFAAFFVGGPLLYAGYAVLLARGNRKSKGGKILLILLLFHFGMAGFIVWLWPEIWDYEYLKKTFRAGPLFTVGGFVPFVLTLLVAVYSAFKSREIQDKPPRCRGCSYNLTGNTSGICPECGEEVQR